MGKHAQSVDTSVLERIRERNEAERAGWVFTPSDFADLGSRAAVASALKRHKAAGTVQQIARGLYAVPRNDPILGDLLPTVGSVVAALQRRDGARIQPAGAYAANMLSLSEQVPAQVLFLTDGPSRQVKVGPMRIKLIHTGTRNMAAAGRLSGTLIQAFRYLGKQHITPEKLQRLRRIVPEAERRKLLDDIALAPAWMRPHFHELARPDDPSH